jgi:hypothetical protein
VSHSGVSQSRTYTAMTITAIALHLPSACFEPWHRSIKTPGGGNRIDYANGPQGPRPVDGLKLLLACHVVPPVGRMPVLSYRHLSTITT